MFFSGRFSVVKMILYCWFARETDTVFCKTDMLWVPGKGIRGQEGAGQVSLSEDISGCEDTRPRKVKNGYRDREKYFRKYLVDQVFFYANNSPIMVILRFSSADFFISRFL